MSPKIKRALEIIPGAASWGTIFFLIALAAVKPVACAILIIVFDFYWIIRTLYLSTLLFLAYHKLFAFKNKDWLSACSKLKPGKDWEKIYHLVLFPVYKEGPQILGASLECLRQSRYPKEKMIVVVSFEERNPSSNQNAAELERRFKDKFFGYISAFHPDGRAGEQRTKGANATWAAKTAKQFLEKSGIALSDVIVSCFDADTCVDQDYFSCLTYHFMTSPNPHRASYQPIPVYNNNIWQAPSFARVVEISGSFCQMIESMRLEKFVTFSSHSMSFKSLVEIGYWPVDMVSDDSLIYWKAYIFYKGDYRVVPLYITVSMDVAYSNNLLKTVVLQYKQKRRWAWGVENFPYVVEKFIEERDIAVLKKIRRAFHLLESHITWAVWAIIVVLIGPLPLLLGGKIFNQMAIGYNLPRITGMLFNFTLITSLALVILSRAILPPRPKEVSWTKNIVMILEWIIVPVVIVILGSTPALDAQTRLMLNKPMGFNPTEKNEKKVV
ncbi:MAG: glycosyltransferase family 2 protein [Candidatus Omnitrophota bacterium]|nr:glycosyltransferase family 2 protein [Candidatus Omnitrophota bacterium]